MARKPKVVPVRGTSCPDCGEERTRPNPDWAGWVDAPHEDMRDCIRYLRSENQQLRDRVSDVRSELEDHARGGH